MQTGIQFTLVGVVQNKSDFDGRDGKVRMVEVGWMGGSHNFICESAAEQDQYPDEGEAVEIRGHILYSKGKAPKFKVASVTAGGTSKSRASA